MRTIFKREGAKKMEKKERSEKMAAMAVVVRNESVEECGEEK